MTQKKGIRPVSRGNSEKETFLGEDWADLRTTSKKTGGLRNGGTVRVSGAADGFCSPETECETQNHEKRGGVGREGKRVHYAQMSGTSTDFASEGILSSMWKKVDLARDERRRQGARPGDDKKGQDVKTGCFFIDGLNRNLARTWTCRKEGGGWKNGRKTGSR